MIITTKTVISFRIPQEYCFAEKFKVQNPDWHESVSSQYIAFVHESTYAVETKEDSDLITSPLLKRANKCRKN